MSAVSELREMAERLIQHVGNAEHNALLDSTETLMLDAASLMTGIANGLEVVEDRFELLSEDQVGARLALALGAGGGQ